MASSGTDKAGKPTRVVAWVMLWLFTWMSLYAPWAGARAAVIVEGEGKVTLHAGHALHIGAQQTHTTTTTESGATDGWLLGGRTSTTTATRTEDRQTGSTVTAGGDLEIVAVGDVNIQVSNLDGGEVGRSGGPHAFVRWAGRFPNSLHDSSRVPAPSLPKL